MHIFEFIFKNSPKFSQGSQIIETTTCLKQRLIQIIDPFFFQRIKKIDIHNPLRKVYFLHNENLRQIQCEQDTKTKEHRLYYPFWLHRAFYLKSKMDNNKRPFLACIALDFC